MHPDKTTNSSTATGQSSELADHTGLTFSDNISVEWAPVDYSPDDDHLAVVNESNESFLRAVASLSAFSGEHSEEEGVISQELQRLDHKINLVLDLVSQLVYKQLEIPAKTRVTLSGKDLTWIESSPPQNGATLFVQVYIQHGTPKPLCFYGLVTTTEEDSLEGRSRVQYQGLSASVQNWLDKLVFRHHRREVAFKRSKTNLD